MSEIRITRVRKETREKLEQLADKNGLPLTSYLKIVLNLLIKNELSLEQRVK